MSACFKQLGLATLLLCSGSYTGLSATEPYDLIRRLPEEPYVLENGYILLEKVNSTNTALFLDVDSPHGEAARYIAANTVVSNNVGVTIFSVNNWHEEGSYHRFLSNVRQEGLDDRITALRMSSAEASNALDVQAGVIFIDCSHSEQLHDKILMWMTQLEENGVIAGNHWQSTSVELAVVHAATQLNLMLSVDQNYWFLTRP